MRQLRVKQVAAGIPSEDRDFAFCLLNALPESYSIVKQTILANQKDLDKLNINSIIRLMLQEEIDQKGLNPKNVDPEVAFASRQPFKGNKGDKRKTTKGDKTGTKTGVCHWCSREGHYEKDCRKKKDAQREAQQGAESPINTKNGKGDENSPPDHSAWVATALSDAPTEEAKTTNGTPAAGEWWEFDSGATQVFHGNFAAFSDYKAFDKPILIGLATNGASTNASGKKILA
ncbi:hypothetical protein FRC00_000735 [Tulasnella sp. 408]|nr:hypothetical protein FRC00_000735 [Tulasnella sp. 408]